MVSSVIDELHAAGSTICRVTHSAELARRFPRTVRLSDGRIVEELP